MEFFDSPGPELASGSAGIHAECLFRTLGPDCLLRAQMAAMHLGSGVIFVTLIARYHLGESLTSSQYAGFALMAVAMVLILGKF